MVATQLPSSLGSKKRALVMLDRRAAQLAQDSSKSATTPTIPNDIQTVRPSSIRPKKRALVLIDRHTARLAQHTTTPTTSNDLAQLHKRLCDLPPEVYCMIKDLTLTVDSNQVITVGPGYRPPVQLQIDKALRHTAGQKFYSTNTFAFHAHPKITPPKGASASDEKIERPFATYMAWNCNLYRSHFMIIHATSQVRFSADGELQIRPGTA